MKKLRPKFEGWPLENPPQTEEERQIARLIGFVELPSGKWVREPQDFRPPLEIIQKYPYGHRCRACQSSFRSQKPRDQYCISCDNIMREALQKLQGIVEEAMKFSPDEQRQACAEVEKALMCPMCAWQGNQNRDDAADLAGVLENLPRLVEKSHRHFMRHMFWNRFPFSRWFTPKLTPQEKETYYGKKDWLKKVEDEPMSYVIGHLASFEFKPLTTKKIKLF
jgi:hypothetical protein